MEKLNFEQMECVEGGWDWAGFACIGGMGSALIGVVTAAATVATGGAALLVIGGAVGSYVGIISGAVGCELWG